MSVRRSLLGRETLQALLRWTIVPPRGIRPSVSRPDVRGFSLFLLASLLERLPRCRLLDPINKVGSASRFREPAKEGRSLFCQFQPKLLAVKEFGKKKMAWARGTHKTRHPAAIVTLRLPRVLVVGPCHLFGIELRSAMFF